MTKRKGILAAAIGATAVAASDQRLEVAFPGDAKEGASFDYFRGGYQSKCL
jgi:hypothetical protein